MPRVQRLQNEIAVYNQTAVQYSNKVNQLIVKRDFIMRWVKLLVLGI